MRHGRGRGRDGPRDTVLADTGQLCVTHTMWTVLVKRGSQAKQSLGLCGARVPDLRVCRETRPHGVACLTG